MEIESVNTEERKSYNVKFKVKVAQEAEASGQIRETARKYDIPHNCVLNWLKQLPQL